MERGKVKFFDNKRGFGFLTPIGGGKDVFVHFSAVKMEGFRKLSDGQVVSFEREMGERGEQACNVTING